MNTDQIRTLITDTNASQKARALQAAQDRAVFMGAHTLTLRPFTDAEMAALDATDEYIEVGHTVDIRDLDDTGILPGWGTHVQWSDLHHLTVGYFES